MNKTGSKIRILLADDHQIVIDGLIRVLEDETDIEVTGTALDGEEVLESLKEMSVDILVLDLSMPRMDGTDTLKYVAKQYPEIRTIILSYSREGEKIHEVVKAGAKGYVLKNRGGKDLVNAIRAVYEGGKFFPDEINETMYDFLARPAPTPDPLADVKISDRETDVLACLMDGMSAKIIADTLNISKHTVDTHKKNIMGKTSLRKDTQLALFASERGIIPWSRRSD